jgi:carboxyl-terminal processing protease
VQKVLEMPDGAALVLSVAKYYAPDGKAIQDAAVTPNIVVASEEDFLDTDTTPQQAEPQKKANKPDEQLDRAIEVLKNKSS